MAPELGGIRPHLGFLLEPVPGVFRLGRRMARQARVDVGGAAGW